VIEPMESSPIISRIGHSKKSSLREQALGHLLLGELLAEMWRRNRRDIEVLKAEVDRGGYDLVLEANGLVRHVQFGEQLRPDTDVSNL
jgi:hypothetical protein